MILVVGGVNRSRRRSVESLHARGDALPVRSRVARRRSAIPVFAAGALSRRRPGLPHRAPGLPLSFIGAGTRGLPAIRSGRARNTAAFPRLERYAARRRRSLSGLIFKPEKCGGESALRRCAPDRMHGRSLSFECGARAWRLKCLRFETAAFGIAYIGRPRNGCDSGLGECPFQSMHGPAEMRMRASVRGRPRKGFASRGNPVIPNRS